MSCDLHTPRVLTYTRARVCGSPQDIYAIEMPGRAGEVKTQAIHMNFSPKTIFTVAAATPDTEPHVQQISRMCTQHIENYTVTTLTAALLTYFVTDRTEL